MFNPMYTIQDNLCEIKNADRGAILHLRNGQQLEGKLGGWSDNFVVLTELSGKEVYDAVVRVSDISAVSSRAR